MTATPAGATACERNREPILSVLLDVFADRTHVLEIGSGGGEHAVHFAAALPWLVWQCSDRPEYLPGIRTRLDEAHLPNTPAPLKLDVAGAWPSISVDAVFSANTLHIMAWNEVAQWFAQLRQVTAVDAVLVIYGPFNDAGRFTSESNAAFDRTLRARDPRMGLRDAQAVDALAQQAGFRQLDDLAMPANNRCRVWRRQG